MSEMGNKTSTLVKYNKMAQLDIDCGDQFQCQIPKSTSQIRRRIKRSIALPHTPTYTQSTPRKRPNHNIPNDDQDLSLEMENLMLRNSERAMGRCSTPTLDYCFHCCHGHKEDCCLYIHDTPSDGPRYSRWIRDLEHPELDEPRHFSNIPEAVAGNATYCMPAYYPQHQVPPMYLRQFYFPFLQPNYHMVPDFQYYPPMFPAHPPIMLQHQPQQMQPFGSPMQISHPKTMPNPSFYMTPLLYPGSQSSYYFSHPVTPSFLSLPS